MLKFFKYVSKLEKLKYPQYIGLMERRQFVCFLFTILVELIYIPANIIGLNGYHNSLVLDIYNWIHLVFVLVLQILFWKNKIATRVSLYLWFTAIALKLSVESQYELLAIGTHSNHIFGNFHIILVLAAVAIAIRLSILAKVLMFMLTLNLVIFALAGNWLYVVTVMRIFFVGYMLILFIAVFDSKDSARGLREPQDPTSEEKTAIKMLMKLNENNQEKVYSLLSRLSKEQQDEVSKNTLGYLQKKYAENLNYSIACPELTKSQILICKLLMQDKSLKEVCLTLHKSHSNVSSQISHIRQRLGLDKGEDVKAELQLRFNQLKKD